MVFEKAPGGPHGINHWLINGKQYPHEGEFVFHKGRRYRLVFHNRSDDSHPLHIHRHLFELVEFNGKPTAGIKKDTVIVPAFGRATVDLVADQPGLTLFHCHIPAAHGLWLQGAVSLQPGIAASSLSSLFHTFDTQAKYSVDTTVWFGKFPPSASPRKYLQLQAQTSIPSPQIQREVCMKDDPKVQVPCGNAHGSGRHSGADICNWSQWHRIKAPQTTSGRPSQAGQAAIGRRTTGHGHTTSCRTCPSWQWWAM